MGAGTWTKKNPEEFDCIMEVREANKTMIQICIMERGG
jgi:hypothetical protein